MYLISSLFNAVFPFSFKPLRMFSISGAGVLGLTAVLVLVYLVMSFLTPPPGLATVLLLNPGVLALGIGIRGEYITKIDAASKRRSLWLVDDTLNLDTKAIR